MEMERDKREEQHHAHAGLAENPSDALHSEVDLSEHEESLDEHIEEEHADYSNYTKQQLANVVKDLAKEENFKRVDSVLREIKPL